MTYTLGVDIGTSYTAAAIWREGRASTVSLADRADSIPSAVFLKEDGSMLIGDAAVRRGVLEPDRLARGFKRAMGDPTPLLLGDETVARTELTGQVLRFVLAKVTAREGAAPSHVTLTVPATWGQHHRELMISVAAEAGLTDVGLLPEPVAVAIHYAAQERIEPGAVIAVYDLGGGTFDAALVERVDDGYELRGQPGGDETIGGEDFDDVLMNQVRRGLGHALTVLDFSDDAVSAGLAQVRVNAIAAKEALSADVDASITVILPGVTREVRVTRGDFHSAIRIPLLRTVDALDRTITSAGLTSSDVDAVLLAGGSSQIPLVSQLIAEELGIRVITDAHPKYAVCLGAALAAAGRAAGSTVAVPGLAAAGATSTDPRWPDPDIVALLAPTGPPEVSLAVEPANIGLAQPAEVLVRAVPVVRRRLRYLSDRDELVVEVRGDARRGSWALLLAAVIVTLVVVGLGWGATRGWFGDDETRLATTRATPPAPSVSGAQGAPARPIALTAMTIHTAPGESVRAVSGSASRLIAVGGAALDDPKHAVPRVWTLVDRDWTATPIPQLRPGRVGQLTGIAAAEGEPFIAVGWSAESSDAPDPKQRRGDIWVSRDGKAWGQATVPDVGELTDVVRLPSGSLVVAGVSYAADRNDGDAVVLTSPDGARWTAVAATGLDGPGPFELRRLVSDRRGLVALGSRLDGAVQRSGLWRSTDGRAWTFDSWLPTTGSGVADGWGLMVTGDGTLLAVGAQSGSAAGPVVWRSDSGKLVAHPTTGAAAASLFAVHNGPSGLVAVGTKDGIAAAWTVGR